MEMNVMETPGRDLADIGGDEAADHQDEALKEDPDQACFPALDRIIGLERDRQHDHEGNDEHVRHAHARGQRADIAAAALERQPIREEGVVHRREAHHQPERGQDAAEDERVRHLQHKPQQAGEHQHIDEDIGAESEKRVPVAYRPQSWALHLGCGRRHHLLLSIRDSISNRPGRVRAPADRKGEAGHPISDREVHDDPSIGTSGLMAKTLRT